MHSTPTIPSSRDLCPAAALVAAALLLAAAGTAAAQTRAEPRDNAFGNNWQTYTVESDAAVRDFHVCIADPDGNLAPADVRGALKLDRKDAAGRNTDYPQGWRVTVDGSLPGHVCINYLAGPNGEPVSGDSTFTLRFAHRGGFDNFGAGAAQLLVTNTPAGEPVNWADAGQGGDLLFRSTDPVRGPRFAAAALPAPLDPPAGSQLLFTGTVLADRPATAAVLGPDGATLSGVVVEIDGDEYVSDESGRFTFFVAAGAATLAAAIRGAAGSAVSVPVVSPVTGGVSSLPSLGATPPYAQPGTRLPLTGAGFSADAAGNHVLLGNRPLDVLAASPSELIVQTPADLPPGSQLLTVTTDQGSTGPHSVTIVALRMQSADRQLRPGEKGKATLVALGTEKPLSIVLTNHSTDSIAFEGGTTAELRTSGGAENRARFSYRALAPGDFRVSATIADPR